MHPWPEDDYEEAGCMTTVTQPDQNQNRQQAYGTHQGEHQGELSLSSHLSLSWSGLRRYSTDSRQSHNAISNGEFADIYRKASCESYSFMLLDKTSKHIPDRDVSLWIRLILFTTITSYCNLVNVTSSILWHSHK